MCGIFGVTGERHAASRVVEGLRRLEYRGYDSAGIAASDLGVVARRRAEGPVRRLEALLADRPLAGAAAIGHTRWATHGRPCEENAHPHRAGRVSLVHNGIVENEAELRARVAAAGRELRSDTDTEVIAHLVDIALEGGSTPGEALRDAGRQVRGAYALAALVEGVPERIFVTRRGSPLYLGRAGAALYLSSDTLALADRAGECVALLDEDVAELAPGALSIRDRSGREVEREAERLRPSLAPPAPDHTGTHMHREMEEQPGVMRRVLETYVDRRGGPRFPASLRLSEVESVTLLACGSSRYAAMVARDWLERLGGLAVTVEIASEHRYREWPLRPNELFVAISQSGETADTLAALRHARARGHRTAALVNVAESTMAREADAVLPLRAGREIGVASTKAFVAQLAVLALLSVAAGRASGRLDAERAAWFVKRLARLPAAIEATLSLEPVVAGIAARFDGASSALFVGRGAAHALAAEGALKLKEISYVHAEGFAAGELKHGPLALVSPETPVVALLPSGPLLDKAIANAHEVAARGGRLIVVTDELALPMVRDLADDVVVLESLGELGWPVTHAVALQLLAYHVARRRGLDVDRPRNLAKAVTVE